MNDYSIIIPHYNIPTLLKRCLMTIPQRDDVQVIVVDDHSSKEVQEQLKELESQFPAYRFVYLEKNRGGGAARNIGLQHAKGKYVLLADADDFFHECINNIFDEYKEETSDIVFFNGDSVDSETLVPGKYNRSEKLQGRIASYTEGRKDVELELRYEFPEPWCKMIRRNMIERIPIRFDEVFAINDSTFSYLVGYHAKTIKIDERKIYCVTYRQNSITYEDGDSIERFVIMADVNARKNRFMKDNCIPVFDESILHPFRVSLRKRNWSDLNRLFDVVGKYGFSKSFILYKLLARYIKHRFQIWLTIVKVLKRADINEEGRATIEAFNGHN